MATHTHQLLRHEQSPRPQPPLLTDPLARVRALDGQLAALADGKASASELAALLHESVAPRSHSASRTC